MGEIVAVYGTLKKGLPNHHYLKRAKFLGEAVSLTRFKLGHGGFPAVVPAKEGAPIAVELYEVSKPVMRALDALEGYPTHYDRAKFLFEKEDGRIVEAWLYYYRRPLSWHDWFEPADCSFPWTWEPRIGWFPYYRNGEPCFVGQL